MTEDLEGKELDFGDCPPQVEQLDDFSENVVVPEEKKSEDSVEVVKKGEVFTLNAKIKEAEDPALSATAGWKAPITSGGGGDNVEVNSDSISEESSDFDLESDGSLPFYMLDAHEEFYEPNMNES